MVDCSLVEPMLSGLPLLENKGECHLAIASMQSRAFS